MTIRSSITSPMLTDVDSSRRVLQAGERFDRLRSDETLASARRLLNRSHYSAVVAKMGEALATEVSFERFKRSLQTQKAKTATLDEATEVIFLERCDQTLRESTRFLTLANEANDLLAGVGMDRFLADHASTIFKDLPNNLHAMPLLHRMCIDVGLDNEMMLELFNEGESARRDWDWNFLKLHGADGTFGGLIQAASGELNAFEDFVEATRRHGLPTLEGATQSTGVNILLGVLFVAAGIALVFFL